jgi:type II secretory pathway pseudopilin PulG
MRKTSHSRGILLSIYSSSRAAIDLASIMVGIIVIGIIGGIIAATVFIVIPWAQDNAAKASIGAVKTAESAYRGFSAQKGAPGSYGNKEQLVNYDTTATDNNAGAITQADGGLLQDSDTLLVASATDSDGQPCYSVASHSGSGKTFYATNKKQIPTEEPQTTADCVLLDETMFPNPNGTGSGNDPANPGTGSGNDPANPGGGTTTPGVGGGVPTSELGSGHVPFPTDVQASTANSAFNISGYNTTPTQDIFTGLSDSNGTPNYSAANASQGQWTWYPANGGDITVSYYDPATDSYIPFMTRQDNWDSNKGDVIDATMMYDIGSGTFWSWFGDSSSNDAKTYADDFKKMSENGGAVKFKSAEPSGDESNLTVTATWEPATGDNPSTGTPTDTPPGWGTQPLPPTNGSNGQDECGPYDSGSYNGDWSKTSWSQELTVPNCSYALYANHIYDDRYQQEPNTLLQSADLGQTSTEGYTTYQQDTRYGPQYNGWFKPSAARGWAAQNGTNVTVEYKDADGNYNNLMTVTQNSDYSGIWSYGDSHTGGDLQDYDQSSSYDSSQPYVNFSVEQYMGQPNVSYDKYYSNTPQTCVADFFNDTYKSLYFDGNGEQHCDDVRENISFTDDHDYTNKNMIPKMDTMAQYGGRVTFTTTAGKTVTVAINPGDWKHLPKTDPGQAT